MKRLLLIGAALLVAGSAWAQFTLPGRYIPGVPGAGVDADAGAVLGSYLQSISSSGDTITVVYQTGVNPRVPSQTFTYTPSASGDGVLDDVQWTAGTKTLTFTLNTGGAGFSAVLDAFLNTTEIEALISPFARNQGPTGTIPDANIPAGIARDSELPTDLTDLDDTPSTITADDCLLGNSTGDAVIFGACGADSLTALSDTPASITANSCLIGNSAGSAVVFGSCSTGSGSGDGVVDTAALTAVGSTITLTLGRTVGSDVDDSLTLASGNIPNLSAGHITSGTLSAARVPNLNANKITAGTLDDARIPAAIARDSEIASYARATPTGTIADAQIPAAIARDSELPDVSGFLDQSEVDGRIATYARISPSGQIADAQIPASIARDSELPSAGVTVQDGGTQEGTGIETLNFGTNLAVAVASGVATITGQAGGGGGASLSDDAPVDVGASGASGTGSLASRDDHRHRGVTSVSPSGPGITINPIRGDVVVTHSHDGVADDLDYGAADGVLTIGRSVGSVADGQYRRIGASRQQRRPARPRRSAGPGGRVGQPAAPQHRSRRRGQGGRVQGVRP